MVTRDALRRGLGVLAAAALLVGLAGCSWRLESAEPEVPEPDEVTAVRDAAALREQDVIDAIAEAGAVDADVQGMIVIESQTAPVRLEHLGGVYVPFPGVTPAPTVSPAPAPGVADAVVAARDGAFADAATVTDENLAILLTSIGLSHALTSWYGPYAQSVATGAQVPVAEQRSLPSPEVAPGPLPETTAIPPDIIAALAVDHDRARYLYEVMAARSADGEQDMWLARRDIHTARAEALTILADGLDDREAVSTVLAEDVDGVASRRTTAVAVEEAMASRYATLLTSAPRADVSWLLHGAFDGYAQAAAFALTGSGDQYLFPALPGIASDEGLGG